MDFDIRPTKRNDTATFKFRQLSPDPSRPLELEIRQLGTTNPAYIDAVFGRASAVGDRKGAAAVAADRDEDLQDIARYCAVSWNVTRGGVAVECTPDEVLKFLRFAAASGYVDEIDYLRGWAKVLGNFREAVTDAASLGKK
jgi:hypothetical protein